MKTDKDKKPKETRRTSRFTWSGDDVLFFEIESKGIETDPPAR